MIFQGVVQGGRERLSSKWLGNGYGGMSVGHVDHEMRNCREINMCT